MNIAIRKLLNPLILNNKKYVGFCGDSEFENENNKLIYGYWAFHSIVEDNGEVCFNLDDEIDTDQLFEFNEYIIKVKNDNGDCCFVKFFGYE